MVGAAIEEVVSSWDMLSVASKSELLEPKVCTQMRIRHKGSSTHQARVLNSLLDHLSQNPGTALEDIIERRMPYGQYFTAPAKGYSRQTARETQLLYSSVQARTTKKVRSHLNPKAPPRHFQY